MELYEPTLHSHTLMGATLDVPAGQDDVHVPLDGDEHWPLKQSAPVAHERPLTVRQVPVAALYAWPGGHAHALAAGSQPLVAAGHEHELAPTDVVLDPPPHATHGDLPVTAL